jgi:hypothetical protein
MVAAAANSLTGALAAIVSAGGTLVPSAYVPVLKPPAVRTSTIDVSPEELVRASLPWDGMEMRKDDLARWNLDRYNEFGAAGKGVEIPIAVPPIYHGSNDLDQQRDVQLNMNNWVNVVEAPAMPDSGGPTLYSSHQKPAGYYRNPYTVPLVSFFELRASVESGKMSSRSRAGAGRGGGSASGAAEGRDVQGAVADRGGDRGCGGGGAASDGCADAASLAGEQGSAVAVVASHGVLRGTRRTAKPAEAAVSDADAVSLAATSRTPSSSFLQVGAFSGTNAAAQARYREEAPFFYDMMPYLVARSKLLQFSAADESPSAKVCGSGMGR